MGQFRAIATSRRWWEMIPDQGFFASGAGSERTLNAALRSVDSTAALVYLHGQCHVLLHLDKILTWEVKITWVNPQNGEERDGGTHPTGNLNERTFPEWRTRWFSTPGHWEDAVLLLDGVSRP